MLPEPANNHSDSTVESDANPLDVKAERALEQLAAILAEIALTTVSDVSIHPDDHIDISGNEAFDT